MQEYKKIKWPKVSVVTPSFNQDKFLEITINSVLGQGYPNLEYIVIDGASTDSSIEIIKKYNSRIAYWESIPDKGQTHALIKGFNRASGVIFTWVNSDDILLENSLFIMAREYMAYRADLYVGNGRIINRGGSIISKINCQIFDGTFSNINAYIVQPASFFTKEAYEKFGPLDIELNYTMDMDFWLRIYFAGGSVRKVGSELAALRDYQGTKTSNGYEYFVFELFFKYYLAVKKNRIVISNHIDLKIRDLHIRSLIKAGSFRRFPFFKAIYFGVVILGLEAFKLLLINIGTKISIRLFNPKNIFNQY